jgi:hypothetical protein
MKNYEYYIDYHRGYWKMDSHWNKCSGGKIAGTGCGEDIPAGEQFLKTGLHDTDGTSFYLCQKCAKQEA